MTGKSAAVRLSNDLFCSYNKNVRPVMKQTAQITVNTTFYIFNMHMVNTVQLGIFFPFFLHGTYI